MDDKAKQNQPDDKVPVRVLLFMDSVDLPGRGSASSVTTTPADKPADRGWRFTIHFVPRIRHHRIECKNTTGAVEVRMVHETHVRSWEPLR